MQTDYVRVRGLEVSYRGSSLAGGARHRAIGGVSFEIAQGSCFALVGESGSGKSTIAKALLGLVPIDSGHASIGRFELPGLSRKERLAFRREVQAIYQDPYLALNPRLSAGTLIEEPLVIHKVPRSERWDRVEQVVRRVRLDIGCLAKCAAQLSGGQRQRVCIARSLVLNPRFLIADEPVSSLDLSVQASIIDLLADLKQQDGLTLLLVSHDLDLVRFVADEVGVLYAGRLVETGPPGELFTDPGHPYTVSLLESVPSRIVGSPEAMADLPRFPPAAEGCPFLPNCTPADMKCRYRVPPLVMRTPTHRVACCKMSGPR